MEKSERKWSARIADGRTIGRKCAFVVGLHNDSVYEDCIASIELNHKEDAEGWFEKYSKIAECMNAHSELQAKANISDEAIKEFQKIIRNQCDEISALKAQLRWRPVSEKPERDGWILYKRWVNENKIETFDDTGPYFVGTQDEWMSFVRRCNVVRWLPIPPAPEGE